MSSQKPTFVIMNTQSSGIHPSQNNMSSPSSSPSLGGQFRGNPFLKRGEVEHHGTAEVNKVLHMRVDMPGCSEKDLKLWVDNMGFIHFFVEAPEDSARGFGGRTYGGTFALNPKVYKVEERQVQVKNGIMWLDVPKR